MATKTIYTFRKTGAEFTFVSMDETSGKATIKDEEGKLHNIGLNTLRRNYKKTIVTVPDPKPETKLNRHQKLAVEKINNAYNWIVGGHENSKSDDKSYEMPTPEQMFNEVYDELMTTNYDIGVSGGNAKTELRFAGKQFILSYLASRFAKDGYKLPEGIDKVEKKVKKASGERKNIKGDIKNLAADEVILKAFTGMVIGAFKITKKTANSITVKTAKGELKFDAKTGKQLDANNPKFANRIVV